MLSGRLRNLKVPATLAAHFKKLVIIAGFIGLFVAAYLTTSAVTSCPANAATCSCSICVYASGGLATSITTITSSTIIPGISAAGSYVTSYQSLAFTSFANQVVGKFTTLQDNFIGWFDTFDGYNLKPAMQAETRQYNVNDVDQARAWAGFADVTDQNRAKRHMEVMEVQTHREIRPSETVCAAGTVTGGMTRTSSFRRKYNAAAPAEMVGRSGRKKGTAAANGRGADIKARWDKYVSRYCQISENSGSLCSANGSKAGQDIDVTGQIFEKDTIDITDSDVKQTVDDLITNIAEPFVSDAIPKGAVNTPDGAEALMWGESHKAKRQVVYDALNHVVSRRIPGAEMGAFLKPMRQEAGVSGALMSDKPSHNEVMEVMMSERFRNGKYSISQIDEPANNSREIVVQRAFQAMQMSDKLDLMDRHAMLLAADLGDETKEVKPLGNNALGAPQR